jgi:hypothetical protein
MTIDQRVTISRAVLVVFLCLGGISAAAPATQVNKGDTIAEVIEKMGEPQGVLKHGGWLTYYYARGYVDFMDGRVQRTDLVSPEKAAQIKAERARAEEESRRQAEAARQRLADEGKAQLSARLADKDFAARPPTERLASWQEFSTRYPYTDVRDQISQATAEADAAQQQRNRTEQLAALAARVAAIQKRFGELDADYAASLVNWKRNEIDAERTNLTQELDAHLASIHALEVNMTSTNVPPDVATNSASVGTVF